MLEFFPKSLRLRNFWPQKPFKANFCKIPAKNIHFSVCFVVQLWGLLAKVSQSWTQKNLEKWWVVSFEPEFPWVFLGSSFFETSLLYGTPEWPRERPRSPEKPMLNPSCCPRFSLSPFNNLSLFSRDAKILRWVKISHMFFLLLLRMDRDLTQCVTSKSRLRPRILRSVLH